MRRIDEHETRYPLGVFGREEAHGEAAEGGSYENQRSANAGAVEQVRGDGPASL